MPSNDYASLVRAARGLPPLPQSARQVAVSRLLELLDLRRRLEMAIAERNAARETLADALAAASASAAPVPVAAAPSPPQQVAQGAPAPAVLACPQSAPALTPVPAPGEEEDGGVLLDDESGVPLDA